MAPDFAIVVPIYRQPGLALEAIACALREAEDANGVAVLVNDGCPFAETQALCQDFATAYPARIDAIHTENGGLSAARNRGIRHALARFPALRAIYLLDADNRLKPGAMRRALAALDRSGADWVYPDVDKFGQPWHGDMSGPYSVLRHLAENICDAGSLIHARVFAAGLSFDETLRDGYEDWDFWLRCIAAGLRGAHCPDFGFLYRARPESMVRDADRMRPQILAGLQRRHPALYAPGNLLRLEHQEAPRFCLVYPDQQRFDFTSAAGASSRAGRLDELTPLFWQAAAHPARGHFPPFIVMLDRTVQLALLRLRLADWLCWRIETLLTQHDIVTVHLTPGDARVVATHRQALIADPDAPRRATTITLPLSEPVAGGTADLAGLTAMLRAGEPERATWRTQALIPGHALYQHVRRLTECQAPLARGATGREVAILVPGSDLPPAARQVAAAAHRAGLTTRIVLVGAEHIPAPDALCDVICLSDAEVLGLLVGCVAVIDCGTQAGAAAMGTLHRQGAVTAVAVAAADDSLETALDYEHALAAIVVPSAALLALSRARGIPAEKLVLLDDVGALFSRRQSRE